MSKQQKIGFDYPELSDDDADDQKNNKIEFVHHIPPNQGLSKDSGVQQSYSKNLPQQFSKHISQTKVENSNAVKAPSILGNRLFVPPPPIGNPRPLPSRQVSTYAPQVQAKERRNCVYVKNIPKHFNDFAKLTTFFKNEGSIHEIRPNPQAFTAMVRFSKEESAIKFVTSGKNIFNRSYIIYSLTEKSQVPIELVREREKDESGKTSRPTQNEVKILKQKLQTATADKMRAIYFLLKHTNKGNQKKKVEFLHQQLRLDQEKVLEIKKKIQKMGEDDCKKMVSTWSNQYDWTLCFQVNQAEPIERKQYLFQIQKRFGPVTNLQIKTLDPKSSDQTVYQHVVKIMFLSIRHCWNYYCVKNNQKEPIQIEGSLMKQIFCQNIFISMQQHEEDLNQSKQYLNPISPNILPNSQNISHQETIALTQKKQ